MRFACLDRRTGPPDRSILEGHHADRRLPCRTIHRRETLIAPIGRGLLFFSAFVFIADFQLFVLAEHTDRYP